MFSRNTHFCRIRDGGGAGRGGAGRGAPSTDNFRRSKTDPNKLYIIGKGIYRRAQLTLDIEKMFWFRDFMTNFREIVEI